MEEHTPEQKNTRGGSGALVGAIIIIIILVVGGIYLFRNDPTPNEVPTDETITINEVPEEPAPESETEEPPLADDDSIESLEDDLENTDLDELGEDIENL